jgi:transcriptional regulator with XRE-family HTH domain
MQRIFNQAKFGRRILKAIEASGLSLRGAAKAMGVDQATLCRASHGGAPSIETYLRIVRWLDQQGTAKDA